MMAAKVKIAAQVLLFVLAVVVFYLGLGVGLQINPTLSSILWFIAAAILALDLVWIVRSRR